MPALRLARAKCSATSAQAESPGPGVNLPGAVRPEAPPPAAIAGMPGRCRALFALLAGVIMGPIDASIVNVNLPVIAADLGVTPDRVGWVSMGYLLMLGSLLLPFGRLGDILGLKRVFLAGLLVFVATSATCAMAGSLGPTILVCLSLTCLLVSATRAPASGGALPYLALGAVGVALALLFVRAEKRSPQPMLDLSLFRNPVFSAGIAAARLNFVAQYVVVFVTPFYLQRVVGLRPGHASTVLAVRRPAHAAAGAPDPFFASVRDAWLAGLLVALAAAALQSCLISLPHRRERPPAGRAVPGHH